MIQQRVNFYRLRFIDPHTGTIAKTYEFYAEDDAAAIKFAEVWSEGAPMELWGTKRQPLKRWLADNSD